MQEQNMYSYFRILQASNIEVLKFTCQGHPQVLSRKLRQTYAESQRGEIRNLQVLQWENKTNKQTRI